MTRRQAIIAAVLAPPLFAIAYTIGAAFTRSL